MNDDESRRIRAAFEAGYEPPSPGFRERVRARTREARTGGEGRLAAFAAAALVVLVVAGLVAGTRLLRPVHTPVPAASGSPAASPSAAPSPAPTPVTGPLGTPLSVHMVDASTGWLITDSHVLRTSDGGVRWYETGPARNAGWALSPAPTSWAFVGSQDAWLGYTNPTSQATVVFRTTDAGSTWLGGSPIPAGVGPGLSLQFVDAQHGWADVSLGAAAGSNGIRIYRTADGGQSWIAVAEATPGTLTPSPSGLPSSCDKGRSHFLDATTGWLGGSCAGGPAVFYRTLDGGQTWTRQALPDWASQGSLAGQVSVSEPVFTSGVDGYLYVSGSSGASNGPSDKAYVYATQDGGQTWAISGAVPAGGLVTFPATGDVVATAGSQLLVSTNGGQAFTTVSGNLDLSNTTQLEFASDLLHGWAISSASPGGTAQLWHTADGGHTWARQA